MNDCYQLAEYLLPMSLLGESSHEAIFFCRLLFVLPLWRLLIGTNSAGAVVFNPGNPAAAGTTSAAEPQLAGPIIEDESIPFSFVGSVTGGQSHGDEFRQRVVRLFRGRNARLLLASVE